MSSPLHVNDFDTIYYNIQDSIDDFHYINAGYLTDMSKNQFDTGLNSLSSYLTVPEFDSPWSNLSSGPSSFPSSRVNTPVGDNPDPITNDEDSGSDSDSEVEPLSLSNGQRFRIIREVAYPTHDISDEVVEDMPYVPISPAHPEVPVSNQRRTTQLKVATAPGYDSDEEPDFESEGGDATEDEYVPTPPLKPLKRRRSVGVTASSSHSVSPTSSPLTPSALLSRPTKRQRTSKESVNAHTPGRGCKPEDWTTEDEKEWRCPNSPCDHRQWNKRGPDFRRHQRTHTRGSRPTPYVCWGVELKQASASRKPIAGPDDKKRGIAVEYEGVMRIGGCFESFSRLDALKRHLEATKKGKGCATDFDDFRGVSDD